MDLQVELRRGRIPVSPQVLSVRSLSAEEVEARNARAGVPDSPLKRLSERHKHTARLVASGASNIEVAVAVGITPARVVQLKNNAVFQELVAYYGKVSEAGWGGLGEKMGRVGNLAADILEDRLEDNPDDFTNDELQGIIKLTADRTGFGPTKTENKNLNVSFGDLLDAARKRVAQAESAPSIAPNIEDAEVIL
jgi:DNA-binding CsgD family transcriptional regulator